MRICILSVQYFGWGKLGGFGTMSRRLAEAAAAAGNEVSVIVPRYGAQAPVERINGVTISSFAPRNVMEARRLLNHSNAEIFHSQNPSMLTLLAQILRPDAKHVVTCIDPRDGRDWWNEFLHATLGRRFRIPLNWFLEGSPLIGYAVRRTVGVYTPAPCLKDKARRVYGLKGSVGLLPNLIEAPKTLPVKPAQPVFTFLGRLDKRKRPELFLELARNFPGCRFVVAGKADSAGRDRKLRKSYEAIPNVEWAGYIDPFRHREELDAILLRTWALINTSSREGLPLSFLEAAGFGCAIVSAVNPEGFASRFGILVENDDFTAALSAVLKDPGAIHRAGMQARKYVLEHCELQYAFDLHKAAYRELLGDSPSKGVQEGASQ